ncbi:MAG: hypothetical protein HZR80_12340 [Candidatus Heimdallarchaeota archaeon]
MRNGLGEPSEISQKLTCKVIKMMKKKIKKKKKEENESWVFQRFRPTIKGLMVFRYEKRFDTLESGEQEVVKLLLQNLSERVDEVIKNLREE